MSEPGAAAVVDALVQIPALHQLHHQACVCRILQAGAVHLQEDTDQSALSAATTACATACACFLELSWLLTWPTFRLSVQRQRQGHSPSCLS